MRLNFCLANVKDGLSTKIFRLLLSDEVFLF